MRKGLSVITTVGPFSLKFIEDSGEGRDDLPLLGYEARMAREDNVNRSGTMRHSHYREF